MSTSIGHDWVLNRANVLEKYLCDLAVKNGAPERYGERFVRLSTQRFDRYYMQNPDDGWIGIRDWVADWIKSEQGSWVLDNIANIRVDMAIDTTSDAVLVVINASVDESLAVEHAMRWI